MDTTTAKNLPQDSLTLYYFDRFEQFRVNHPESMAITLCPKKTDLIIPWRQHHRYGYHYHKILQKSCHFMFVPEFRITDNSIHYHGYIQPFNLLSFKSRTFSALKRLGFYQIKSNPNLNWSLYCVKEAKCTAPLINNYFLNCGPYMFYNNCKELFKFELTRIDKLSQMSKNGFSEEAKIIKKESQNIKLYFNFKKIL